MRRCRRLPQALPAQAISAIRRHRQLDGFLGAPAGARQAAGEFRAAADAGEAARGWNFYPICHETDRFLSVFFHIGFIAGGRIIGRIRCFVEAIRAKKFTGYSKGIRWPAIRKPP
jgi:hypothetical protein